MTSTDTLIAAAWVVGIGIGLIIGYWLAFIRYAPPIQPDQETYNVPDPRIEAINRQIEQARAKHKPVRHLMKQRTQIAHEGLRQ